MRARRSGRPINLTVEALGDRGSLIVIRDPMFGNRCRSREVLPRSAEGIASNRRADRPKRLEAAGVVSRRDDPGHTQKGRSRLTEASIALVPVRAHLGGWGRRHTPASNARSVRAKILADGGPKRWAEFVRERRRLHLEAPAPEGSVLSRPQSAHDAATATPPV